MLPLNKGDGNMKRFFRIFSITLLLICTFSFAQPNLSIKVNNKTISSDVAPFIKNGTTYVPVKFVAEALKVDSVTWNSENRSIIIKNSGNTILLFINKNYAYVNNQYTALNNNTLIKGNRTFVPIRFVSEILGAKVEWDEDTYTVSISTQNTSSVVKNSTTPSTSTTTSNETITNDDVYWLSRIIEAEAAGEPYKGKVAVGEVILNRVRSQEFPNTIWGVIFDKNFGVQFEPVANGTIYNTPSADSIKAAKEALNGSSYVGDCLYFLNPKIASSTWISKNRQYYTTISNHEFYV